MMHYESYDDYVETNNSLLINQRGEINMVVPV